MAFMAGLALGAHVGGRAPDRRRILAALATLVAVAATTAFCMRTGIAWNLWLTGAGATFASVARALEDRPQAARLLYGADLLGGSVAAVIGGLILLPLLGLRETAMWAAALAATAGLWA
jgi:hypothetical protein